MEPQLSTKNPKYSPDFLRGYRRGLIDGLEENCGCDEPAEPEVGAAPSTARKTEKPGQLGGAGQELGCDSCDDEER